MLRRASALAVLALLVPAAAATAQPKAKTAPAGGHLKLYFSKPLVYHKQAFGIVGRPIFVKAVISQFVPGQRILMRAYRGKHRVMSKRVPVRRKGRRGVAVAKFTTGKSGPARFTAGHRHTRRQHRVYAKARRLYVHSFAVNFGSTGAVVDLIQRKLAKLHYRAYRTGTFDGATGRALLAYRKVNNQARVQYAGRYVIGRLIRDKGAFKVKYPKHGRHVEADLSRQVIALINPGGKVYETFPISSGKPSTPTVLGHYSFYLKTFGTNSEGMVDSNYFIRGYAIHGYPSVPNYAASHGCLRTFIADAGFIYSWVRIGDGIDVYF